MAVNFTFTPSAPTIDNLDLAAVRASDGVYASGNDSPIVNALDGACFHIEGGQLTTQVQDGDFPAGTMFHALHGAVSIQYQV